MGAKQDQVTRLLSKLDTEWSAFRESFAGLSDARLTEPRVVGDWSVRDLMAHVTTWEQEALSHLPQIAEGHRPPTYARAHGGIDAFNALMEQQKRALSIAEVQIQFDKTHQRLVDYLRSVPPEFLDSKTRFRRRLRLDTYSHYPIHAEQIRKWRSR